MKKYGWLFLSAALLGLMLTCVRPQYHVTVAGTSLPASYSGAALRQGLRAAEEAADEILRYEAKMPQVERRLVLSFRPAGNDTQALTAALLRSVSGITQADAVFVNGIRLGTVEDGRLLVDQLRASIRGQMPLTAVSGNISGRLELCRVYTRADDNTDYDDMVLLITGMAPVIYLDSGGKLA